MQKCRILTSINCLEFIREPRDLNILMFHITQLNKTKEHILYPRLEFLMRNSANYKGKSHFYYLLDLASLFKFINQEENYVWATPTGKLFVNSNPKHRIELTEKQRKLLFTSILFGRNRISSEFEKILKLLKFNRTLHRYEQPFLTSPKKSLSLGIRLFLSSLKILKFDHINQINFIDPNYNMDIRKRIRIFRFSDDLRIPSEKDLERSKQAELLIYAFEKQRLEEQGLIHLSESVELISEYDSAAGFDIKSYQGIDSNVHIPDKFIEVKSSVNSPNQFFMTQNELKTAKELKEQYCVISIGRYEIGKKIEECELLELNDPMKDLFDLEQFDIQARRIKFKKK